MSKTRKIIICALGIVTMILIYTLDHYGFTKQINPMTLLLGTMVWIGVFAVVGNYLNKKDLKGDKALKREIMDRSNENYPNADG